MSINNELSNNKVSISCGDEDVFTSVISAHFLCQRYL